MKMDQNKKSKNTDKNEFEVHNNTNDKGKVENQNQTHNSRREGMGPNTKRRSD
jgi:hypothetical protein